MTAPVPGPPHVAVVTGASRGIGRAIARRLASAGMVVACSGRTLGAGEGAYPGSLDETVSAITRSGGTAVGLPFDLADPAADPGALIVAAAERCGAPVDVVVHDAANERRFDVTFETMTRDLFDATLRVNVWAGWRLAQAALDGMRRRGAGWILFVSSRAAGPRVGPPYPNAGPVYGQCLYGSTKAALDRLTTGAASELWASNVAVNALAPESAVATDNARTVARLTPERCEPEETMAEAALALVTGDPRRWTGKVVGSLSLLAALARPVRTLDGKGLVGGWQPGEIAPERLLASYLAAPEISAAPLGAEASSRRA